MRKKILTVFFILILTSQVYGLALGHKADLNEKRLLARAPKYKADQLLKHKYYEKLGNFLNDRYPFRRHFIISKNWVDYYIFNTSPSSKVHLGNDGWLYLKSGLKDYLKDDCKKRKKARRLAGKLNAIEKLLESKGKKFFFIVAPDKATIYPEHVRYKRPQNNCGMNFYELFLQAMEEYPLRGFIRLDDLLVEAKKDFPIYFTTGTHWNDRASIIVGNALLKRLSAPQKTPGLAEVKFRDKEQLRDLTTMWGLGITEMTYSARIIKGSKKIKTTKLTPLANGRPRLNITTTAAAETPLLPRTVMYRDSFMTVPLNMMQGSFKEIDALWSKKIPVDSGVDLAALKASQIIIIEIVERNLEKLNIREKIFLKAFAEKTDT